MKPSLIIASSLLILSLTACNTTQSGTQTAQAQKVAEIEPAAGGSAATERVPMDDPLLAHMRARRQVNPNEPSGSREYTWKAGGDKLHAPVPPEKPPIKLASAGTMPLPSAPPPPAVKEMPKPEKRSFKPAQGLKPEPGQPAARLENASIPVPAPAAASNVATSKDASIKAIRIGEHSGHTRVVFDCSGTIAASYNLEPGNKTLRMDFKAAEWTPETEKWFSSHPLFEQYSVQKKSDGTTHLVLQFKKSAKIKEAHTYKPNDTYAYHRIVLDIAPLDSPFEKL